MFRRNLITSSLAAVILLAGIAGASPAFAVDDLRIIAPAAPGGGWDQTARALEAAVNSADLAESVAVENVPGAGGTIGLAQLADREEGNGNVLMVSGLVMVGAIITNKAPVTLEQVTPIARLTGEYEVVVVPADSELQSMDDLIEKLKADTASVSWGGGSAGGTDHILAGLIAKEAGADLTKLNYIPFSGGGEALAAILGGHVTAGVSGYSEWEGQILSGELRALAISSPERVEGIDVPTLKEQGIDVELANWRGIVAPPGLDDAEKAELLNIVDAAVKTDSWKDTLAQKKWTNLYLPGDEFAELIALETERTTEILKSVGLTQ